MPEVTCPRCETRQEVGSAGGYTCVSCGAAWVFATCENCAVRFHMHPGTTAWTCPECGHENGTAAMVDLGAEPEPEPAVVAAPRHAAPAAPPKQPPGPPTRAKLATIAAIGIAVVLLVAFALSAFGGDGADTAGSVGPSVSSPAPSSSLTTTETLCLHLRDLQLLRVDNYTRVAAELADDEAAIQAAGDAELASAVTRMRNAVLAYRDALAAQSDMTAVTQEMGKASSDLPCG